MITIPEILEPNKTPKLNVSHAKGLSGTPARVKRDYFGKNNSELSVFIDDNLELLDDSNPSWWLMKDSRSGHFGYVPSAIVQTSDELLAMSNALQNIHIESPKHSRTPSGLSKKKVSFSNESPVQYLIEKVEYDSDSVTSLNYLPDDEDGGEAEEIQSKPTFLQSALIDDAVKKILGIDEPTLPNVSCVNLKAAMKEEGSRIISDEALSNEERICVSSSPKQDTSKFTSFFKSFTKKNTANDSDGLVKIFSGNIAPLPSYKSSIVEDSISFAELECIAKRLFLLNENDSDYELTLVNDHSFHAISTRNDYSLGVIKEISKICTIEDGSFLDEKGKPVSRHRKKVPRSHLLLWKKRKQSIIFHGIKNEFIEPDLGLERHPKSDFPTNYKFVLNSKIAPFVRNSFYIWIKLCSPDKEQQENSEIAMLVKPLTTVEEIIYRSIEAMEIAKVPGIFYDLAIVLETSYINQYKFSPDVGKGLLSRELTLNDIHNQWPYIDGSGLRFLLKSFVIIGSSPSSNI